MKNWIKNKLMAGRIVSIVLLSIVVFISGCTQSETDATTSSGGGTSADSSKATGEFTPDCGVVLNGFVKGTVKASEGRVVKVTEVIGSNLVAIKDPNIPNAGPELVKLHGIGAGNSEKRSAALALLRSLASNTEYFYLPNASCSISLSDGGRGVVGNLITNTGVSFAEELLKKGLADVDSTDVCGGPLIASCYTGLKGTQEQTKGELNSFLWKPSSDSDGKLAIHTGPYGTDVYVNGEKGDNAGSGNGYGSLARFGKSGCSYGNPQIKVIDIYSGLPYTVGGKSTFTVPSSCGRNCLDGGVIKGCSKN